MKEITIDEEVNTEEIKIALSFLSSKIHITINSDYSSLIKEICFMFKISKEEIESIDLHYFDADKDKINITNEGDYEIFYSQVKDEIVKEVYLDIKDDSKLDTSRCLTNFEQYLEIKSEEQINLCPGIESNEIKNEKNNNEDEEDEENKNTIYIEEEKIEKITSEESNNNKININFIDNYFKESDKDNENNNDDAKEQFKCSCKRCEEYPIVNVLYYCPECELHLCEKCHKKMEDHEHELLKIESNEEYNNAVGESFEPIYKEKTYNIVLNNDNDENENENDNNNNNNQNQNQKSTFSLSNFVPKFIKNYWNKNKNQQ